jgi:UDP-N-acetyl-D-mannosaminuronic acid dehydrogenase
MKTINIYGLGYIGLPTASLLATKGYDVLGIDISERIVTMLNQGDVHIVEPDLDILVKSAVNSKKLKASLTPKPADIHIITVPTPFRENHEPDLSYVESATRTICSVLKAGDLVILESTSPVGSTEKVLAWITQTAPALAEKIFVAYSPERVIPGKVLQELVENDRIVGGINAASTTAAAEFYRTFVNGTVFSTNTRTAEMCKLAENAFRDVNIAFANELSLMCDDLNVDVWELISYSNRHPRVNILQPGPGVGGHCIAVDPWFLVHASPHAKLIKQARLVNDSKPHWVIDKVINAANTVQNPVIACLGAAFKANIDDLRESPSLDIIHALQQKNIGEVLTVEPHVECLKSVTLVSLEEALTRANILVLLVDHHDFKKIDHTHLKNKCVIDTRGFFSRTHT